VRIAGTVPLIAEASWLKQAFRAICSRSNGSAIAGAFDAMPAIGAPPTAEETRSFLDRLPRAQAGGTRLAHPLTAAGRPDTITWPKHPLSSFLNVRVADIHAIYDDWSARGAESLTPPQDRGREIRCYLRDPDGHLIEVGQATSVPQTPTR
jgi:hypothetical protein